MGSNVDRLEAELESLRADVAWCDSRLDDLRANIEDIERQRAGLLSEIDDRDAMRDIAERMDHMEGEGG